jgi:cysteine desulfurase
MEKARKKLSALINGDDGKILFTGCATEANNLAVNGVAEALYDKGRHIISTTVEHPSIQGPLDYLAKYGWEITRLAVDSMGMPDPDDLKKAIRKDTILVSVMHANNETGTVMPITELVKIAKEKEVLFHTDAAQSMGKILVNVKRLNVDLLTIAGHKFYAPKGTGALWVREGTPLAPILHGGGQEAGLRSGTENVMHIVGLGEAARVSAERFFEDEQRIEKLRDSFHRKLADQIEVELIGHPERRLPNTLNLSFIDCKGERVLDGAPDVAASLGAACHERNVTMSPVLSAMGVDPMIARGAVRFSLGRFTNLEEIEKAAYQLVEAAKFARKRG